MTMKTIPYLLQALSPLHAGTGHSVGVIDLPIARMRATKIPYVPGSSIKGVLRERRRASLEACYERVLFGPFRELHGPEGDTAAIDEHAGALTVADARLLALPVRSFKGTFAMATSPLLLCLAARDLESSGLRCWDQTALLNRGHARVPEPLLESRLVVGSRARIYLEDLDLELDNKTRDAGLQTFVKTLQNALPQKEGDILKGRFVLVDDETMSFLWETATQIDTRVRIDRRTGVVADGALWTEESLPPETLLMGLLTADRGWNKDHPLSAEEVLDKALPNQPPEILQLGGKATVGRGRCRIQRFTVEAGS